MAEGLMYSGKAPPFTLDVFYNEETTEYRLLVKHADGRERECFLPSGHEPLFGIDIADQAEIDTVSEAMCREIENEKR